MGNNVVASKEETTAFITSIIKELEKVTGIFLAPDIQVVYRYFVGKEVGAYNAILRKFIFKPIIFQLWTIDKDNMKKYLKYLVAHEYYHYTQDVRGELPHAYKIRPIVRAQLETEAEKFAQTFSGLSREEARELGSKLYTVYILFFKGRL